MDVAQDFQARIQDPTAVEIMNSRQCIKAYLNQYISSWGDLFVELSPAVLIPDPAEPSQNPLFLVGWDDRAMDWSSILSPRVWEWADKSLADTVNSPAFLALSEPTSYPSYR